MAPTKSSPKRRTLTADKIIEQAFEIADKDGLEDLSMRKLSAALGTTAMSLYNHVANKDELLDLMLNRVAAEFVQPSNRSDNSADIPEQTWQKQMRQRANAMRTTLLRHPWAPPLLISRITTGEPVMRDVEETLRCLTSAGFTIAQADWARNAIDSHVYGYTMQEINIPVAPENYQTAASQYFPNISPDQFPFMHEAARQIIDGEYDGVTQFSFGLDLILDGLEALRAKNTLQNSPIED